MPGFTRGRQLDKIGHRGQDTAELFFGDVFVPHANLVGRVGGAMDHRKFSPARDRLGIAVGSIAAAEAALWLTLEYVRERRAFDKVRRILRERRVASPWHLFADRWRPTERAGSPFLRLEGQGNAMICSSIWTTGAGSVCSAGSKAMLATIRRGQEARVRGAQVVGLDLVQHDAGPGNAPVESTPSGLGSGANRWAAVNPAGFSTSAR